MNTSTDSTSVYFISAGASPIKIGISYDPFARLKELQTAHYKQLHLLFTLQCVDRAAALELESAFHRWYEDRHIRLEWYDITPGMIEQDVKILRGLARLVTDFVAHTSWEDMMHLEQRAQQSSRTPDAMERMFKWLDEHPEDVTTPVRELARQVGVGKSSAYEALKLWKEKHHEA